MPDENKLAALREAGFVIRNTCITCWHFERGRRSGWGTCGKILYDHKKHGQRYAGVTADGWCPSYKRLPGDMLCPLGAYEDFLEASHA